MNPHDLQKHFHECMPLFIALGDEGRLKIIEILSGNAYNPKIHAFSMDCPGINVREITRQTSLSRPAVSHHLKILKDAGLIGVHHIGTSNYYYLTISECTEKLLELVSGFQQILPKSE